MLRVTHLTAGYPRTPLLADATFALTPDTITGLVGANGSGKSTLVRMINGLDTPSAGELLLDDTNIVGMSEKKLRGIRRNIGMIFQQFNLMNSRTAAGNIEYPLQLQGVGKQERSVGAVEGRGIGRQRRHG